MPSNKYANCSAARRTKRYGLCRRVSRALGSKFSPHGRRCIIFVLAFAEDRESVWACCIRKSCANRRTILIIRLEECLEALCVLEGRSEKLRGLLGVHAVPLSYFYDYCGVRKSIVRPLECLGDRGFYMIVYPECWSHHRRVNGFALLDWLVAPPTIALDVTLNLVQKVRELSPYA